MGEAIFDIHVHPDGLRHTAGLVDNSAAQLGTSGHWLDSSLTVGQAQPGWQSASALADCARNWQNQMSATVQQLRTYSANLHQSACTYDEANAEAMRRFDAALGDLRNA